MQRCQHHLLLALLICSCSCMHPATAAAATPQQTQAAPTPAPSAAPAEAAEAGPPPFCKLTDAVADAADSTSARPCAGPTSMVWGGNMLKVYHNLYFHNKKWFAVLDGSSNSSSIDAGISLNAQLIKLPTTDSKGFQHNLKVCQVTGVTLLLDFPFPAFPDNLGHWAELLLPLYSALSTGQLPQLLQGQQRQYIDRLLLLNVRPQLLYSWPKEVLGLALNPALPPWPVAKASSSSSSSSIGLSWDEALPWEQPLPPIITPVDYEAWSASGWMVFENVVVLQDRYPIVSMPDETRPPRPTREATAAPPSPAAAAAAAAAVPAADLAAATAAAEAAAAVILDTGDLWANSWVVGFSTPHQAAQFRREALARHFWDRPIHKKASLGSGSSSSSRQQQCEAEGGVSADAVAGAAAAAGVGSGSDGRVASRVPRTVTVLWYPEDYPPVTNHLELVRMLEELTEPYGFKVRVVSLTMGAPFLSHMATMADTGLLVGRHGPLLASAVLLPPGAAVLELLPYKWEWRGVSRLYYNMTQSTGWLHHWAWRPLDAKWCRYKELSDARYAGWLPTECQGRDCLLVHARAGLEVDLDAVRELLSRKLPGLLAGQTVEQLHEPWPAAD